MKSAYSKTLIILVFGVLSIWPAVKANEEDLSPNTGLIDSNGTIAGNIDEECKDGDIKVKVEVGDDGTEETFKLEEYQSPYQCQFEESVYLPENIKRVTDIYDWSCSGPCPEYATVNNQIIRPKDLIKEYYSGDPDASPNAGIDLCNLLETNPEALKGCLIANFDTLLITENVPASSPSLTPQGCNPTLRENPQCSEGTCPGNEICALTVPLNGRFGSCSCKPPCESALSCGNGVCPLSANGKIQKCSYGKDFKSCFCEEDIPPQKSCDTTLRENPQCSEGTCPGNEICALTAPLNGLLGSCSCKPSCESALSCGNGGCPLSANGKIQKCSYGKDFKSCFCEKDNSCKAINSPEEIFQCGGLCPDDKSCEAGVNGNGYPVCICQSSGCPSQEILGYLPSKERNNLTNKWQIWNDKCSSAENTVVYAATKQEEFGIIQSPSSISIELPVTANSKKSFQFDPTRFILAKNIVPNNEIALEDLKGNVYPDFRNKEGRREAGTFPLIFSFVDDENKKIIARFKPYYNATFLSEFTSGLGYYSQAEDKYSINKAFHNLKSNWEPFRRKFIPLYQNGGKLEPQNPIKSPWNANPSLDLTNSKPDTFVRYAILLEGKGLRGKEETEEEGKLSEQSDQYAFHNNIEFMKYILINYYNFDEDKIYHLNKGKVSDFKQTFATVAKEASSIKSSNPKTKVQVVIYYAAHGRAKETEEGLEVGLKDTVENTQGAKRFEMRFEGGDLTESDYKQWTKELFFTPLENNTFNSVDQLFFIPEACQAGGAVI